jgi:hypothetical protein
MTGKLPAPTFDGSFPHRWQAEILSARPLILPTRHFVYPTQAEEVERGALEVLVRPIENEQAASTADEKHASGAKARVDSGALVARDPEGTPPCPFKTAEPFLATCALGFRDPAVPTGLWSTPNPGEICAVSGGYAYIVDTAAPEHFAMIPYRPVLEIRPITSHNLLLFVGHHSILAWGKNGQAWQSEKLTSEGLTITSIDGHNLHGQGWDMMTDKEIPFTLDLRSGLRLP